MTAVLMAFAAVVKGQAEANTNSKKFVLVVRVPETYDTGLAKQVAPAWDEAVEYWKDQGAYVDSFPFPQPGYVIGGSDRQLHEGLLAAGGQKVVSIVVLQAAGIAQANELAKWCPVLDYGGTVEVRERTR